MSDIISILPDHVANQIAAGEVIQRPSSVVKELLENSIDAKADEIKLIIKDSGKTIIQVIDNGIGISKNDLPIAFQRHATSKIKSVDDLFVISSKGFRGEALASICAISNIEVNSKTNQDEIGTCLKITGGKIISKEPTVISKGTSIAVKNLFFNVPARRNFLKSDKVELRHIIEEFNRVALSHPEVKFIFIQNNSELFSLPISNFKIRIINIFGKRFDDKLVPVKEMTSLAGIEGFILKPEFVKKYNRLQFFFVNNRFIRSPFLNHAICSGFEGLIKEKYNPGYFILIKVNPKKIDINIHPTKTEIKFEEEQHLYAIIKSMIKHSLGIFQIAPVLDFDRNQSLEISYELQKKKIGQIPTIQIDSSFNPFKFEKKSSANFSNDFDENLNSQFEFQSENENNEELKLNVKQIPKVFQLFKKYIVTSTSSGLLIINQRRAHQRILYENFLKIITQKKVDSQQLIFPKIINLSKEQLILYDEYRENLSAIGFNSKLVKSKLTVLGVPSICDFSKVEELFQDILVSTESVDKIGSFSQGDYIAKILSRSLSIEPNKIFSTLEQQALVDDLFACKDPLICPFNRKIFINLDKDEFDKKLN